MKLFLYVTFQITELNGSVENVKAEQKRWKCVNKKYYFNLYYKKFALSFKFSPLNMVSIQWFVSFWSFWR